MVLSYPLPAMYKGWIKSIANHFIVKKKKTTCFTVRNTFYDIVINYFKYAEEADW